MSNASPIVVADLAAAYERLERGVGSYANIVVEPSVRRFAGMQPEVNYRVHVWRDARYGEASCVFARESADLDSLIDEAIAEFTRWQSVAAIVAATA